MEHTTISIPKELAARIDSQGAEISNSKRSTYAQFLIRTALDIVDIKGVDAFLAAKRNDEQRCAHLNGCS